MASACERVLTVCMTNRNSSESRPSATVRCGARGRFLGHSSGDCSPKTSLPVFPVFLLPGSGRAAPRRALPSTHDALSRHVAVRRLAHDTPHEEGPVVAV